MTVIYISHADGLLNACTKIVAFDDGYVPTLYVRLNFIAVPAITRPLMPMMVTLNQRFCKDITSLKVGLANQSLNKYSLLKNSYVS